MSLNQFLIHTATIQRNDDRNTGRRANLKDGWTTVETGRRCAVHDIGPEHVVRFGQEATTASHKIHFGAFVKLDGTYRLVWVDPDDGATRYLLVKGTKRPRSKGMPYIVYAEEQVV